MKKRYIAILVGLMTLFTSCEFLNLKGSSNTEGETSVRISLGAAESARTITSAATSLVDTFSVTLTDSDGTKYNPDVVASGEEVEIIVSSEGDFTVEVKTFDSDGVQNGLGNESGSIALGDILEVAVSISFSQINTGDMSLPISFPIDQDIASVTASFLDDEASSILVSVNSSLDVEAGTANLTATDVPSGLHYLVVNFINSEDDSIGSVVEAVNIWDGATSSSWLSDGTLSATRVFTTEDIAYSSTVSTLVIAGKVVKLTDTTDSFEYNITDESVFFYLYGISDNSTVTYTWNGGTATSCEEEVSSANLATNSTNGTNTLVLTFTAEDSSVTTHTVTFTRYCQVEFSNNYGSDDTQTVQYGTVVTKPTNPTATGFIFGGWFTNATCTSAYDFDTLITNDTTLYAKWTQMGGVSVSISSPEYQSIYFTQFGEVVTSITLDVNGWLPLTMPAGATSYQWKLDVSDISGGTSSSYTYTPSTVGQHTLTATAVYDGVSYSGDLVVNVTNEYMVTIIPVGKSATFTEATWLYTSDASQTVNVPFEHTLTRPYNIGKYEVSYTLWSAVYTWAQSNGYTIANEGQAGYLSYGVGGPQTGDDAGNHPVTKISWQDVLVWCNAYSEMVGLSPVYYSDTAQSSILRSTDDLTALSAAGTYTTEYANLDADGYRLPSEGEWQFAASCDGYYDYNHISGCETVFDSSDSISYEDYANVGTDESLSCGTKLANMWGLFDMSGNVWEVCFDLSDNLPSGNQLDYVCTTSSVSTCVSRGGSFSSAHLNGEATVGNRATTVFADLFNDQGFRIARTIQ